MEIARIPKHGLESPPSQKMQSTGCRWNSENVGRTILGRLKPAEHLGNTIGGRYMCHSPKINPGRCLAGSREKFHWRVFGVCFLGEERLQPNCVEQQHGKYADDASTLYKHPDRIGSVYRNPPNDIFGGVLSAYKCLCKLQQGTKVLGSRPSHQGSAQMRSDSPVKLS